MDTRDGLLAAALRLFTARGYEAVGVQEIVTTAGVTKPTLYHFFGSKLGLLEALFHRYGDPLDLAVAQACDYQGNLPQTLERVAATYLEFAAGQPEYYRLELAAYFGPQHTDPHRLASEHQARRQACIEEVFRQAQREHGNMRGRQRRYAISLIGHLNTYIALRQDGELVITDKLRRDMLHQFSHGIYS